MKNINGLLSFFVLGFVFSTLSAILFFSESESIMTIADEQSDLGHQLIEARDKITLNSIDSVPAPYDFNVRIVDVMKHIRKLLQRVKDNEVRLIILKGETLDTLNDFYHSASEVSLTLENLVGVLVARESVFSALVVEKKTQQLIINHLIHNDLLKETGQQIHVSILANLINQQQTYLSILGTHENLNFVESGELQLRHFAHTARDWAVFSIFSAFLFISGAAAVITHQRRKELLENHRLYKDAAEKTETAIKTKSLFLATMSHELRTPMNGVLGVAQIIEEHTKEVETKRHAHTIIESGEHLMTILNDILDFSKMEQGKMTLESCPFYMNTIVDSVNTTLRSLTTKKSIALHFNNQIPSHAQVEGDPARIRQILFNLVGNSIKFTQQGEITVSFDIDNTKGGIQIKVTDTGVGIERERLDAIFTPFEQADLSTTRKFGGTGLGLSIVKLLIDAMGGGN